MARIFGGLRFLIVRANTLRRWVSPPWSVVTWVVRLGSLVGMNSWISEGPISEAPIAIRDMRMLSRWGGERVRRRSAVD